MLTARNLIEEFSNSGHFAQLATARPPKTLSFYNLVVQAEEIAEGMTARSLVDYVLSVVNNGQRELVALLLIHI